MTLQPGTRLGSYEITSPLGSGGMGEVYKAKDLKLGRDAAIKVLREELASDPERLRRFEQEARSASALNHPNIITIYDIGKHESTPYIAMEYVEGRTLREMLGEGPLPTKKLLPLATQIAEGLAKAHSAGIVHRDLKPENLMVTGDGYVKILDFGLAKLRPPPSETQSEAPTVTREGTLVGTVGYMSPEQAKGQSADFRSDQFSLGAVLYEMVTGKRAFLRDSAVQTLSAIIEQEPESIAAIHPETPAHLRIIVERCLAKNPEERYDSTRDLARELKSIGEIATRTPSEPTAASFKKRRTWPRIVSIAGGLAAVLATVVALDVAGLRDWLTGGQSPPRIDSIAVLPLENLSGDPEQEYFSDGMTEELIAELAKIGALRVISRQSVMRFKNADTPLPEIAQALNVGALVEGSVRRSGDRVRISTQLVQANPERHLWAESYERDMQDILSLQSEVAQAIAREIRTTVTPEEEARLARTRPVNADAHEAYLLGRHHRDNLSPADLRLAIEYFQQAIDLDPDFALPYAYLVHALVLAGGATGPPLIPWSEAMERAQAAANRALEIDPQLSEAHAALGNFLASFEWDWLAAEKSFRQAITLNPGSAEARHLFAANLSMSGRHQEAISEMKRALDLDPLNLQRKAAYGMVLYVAREYDQAIQQLQNVVTVNPSLPQAHRFLGMTYLEKEMYDEAIAELRKAVALAEHNSLDLSLLGWAYVAAGKTLQAKEILEELEKRTALEPLVDSMAQVHIYWMQGNREESFSWLERAIKERHTMVRWLKVTPFYDALRSDARFQDLLRRMNFPE